MTSAEPQVRLGRGRLATWLALAAALVSLAILLSLGFWQVQRLAWKEELIATIDARTAAEPVPLSVVLASDRSLADEEYRPVRVEGAFVHAAERHFFATHGGASGFYVYTPLRLDNGDHLFVNRGFVPYDRKDPATRPESQPQGPVSVVGLVRVALVEKPSAIVPDNNPAGNVFYWKDIRAMAASAGLPEGAPILGLFVDADDTPNPGGLPIGGVTIVNLSNNHLQYAVTWFGVAAALAGVLGVWGWRAYRGNS